MYNKINYKIVGIFVTIFTVGLIAFAFWLGKYDKQENYKLYKIYFSESVNGLSKDSTVKLKGVDIGRVESISIAPNDIEHVQVLVKIRDNVPIKEDMYAHLALVGVTGLVSVVIDGGSNKSKLLTAKDGKIPIIKSKLSWINDTKRNLLEVNNNINKTLLQIQKLLNDENLKNVQETLKSLKNASGKMDNLEEKTVKLVENFDKFTKSLKEPIANFNKAIKNSDENLDQITKELLPTIKKFKKTVDNFNTVTLKVKKGLVRGDYNLRRIFTPVVNDTRVLTTQLNILLQHLDQSPSDIIFQSRQKKRGPGE